MGPGPKSKSTHQINMRLLILLLFGATKLGEMSRLKADTDSWLVKPLYQQDIATTAPFPDRYSAESVSKWSRCQCLYSGYLASFLDSGRRMWYPSLCTVCGPSLDTQLTPVVKMICRHLIGNNLENRVQSCLVWSGFQFENKLVLFCITVLVSSGTTVHFSYINDYCATN